MTPQSSSSFGKRHEYLAIAELLERGYDVYQTLVDDQGIDCVIRKEINKEPKYIYIQIKARSNEAQIKHAGRWAGMKIPSPRPNYIFMFYSKPLETYWIIPSLDITNKLAYMNKSGKNQGKYTLQLTGTRRRTAIPKKQYEKYRNENGFHIIENIFESL